ncbi:MAG: hypothetical protein ACJ8GO_00205, partial [Ramlibacter sp.]
TLRKDVRTLPSGAVPDPLLLEWLARTKADWPERTCVGDPSHCALWIVDLDGNGTPEAVLLRESGKLVGGTVYVNGPNGWARDGELQGLPMSLADWTAAIDAQAAVPVKARWPDLQVGKTRYSIR